MGVRFSGLPPVPQQKMSTKPLEMGPFPDSRP